MDLELEPVIEVLSQVLSPLPDDKRQQLVAWFAREAALRPIVQYCCDERNSWQLGGPDPMAPDEEPRTVFAMVEVEDHVVVYWFQEMDVSGQVAIQFGRNVVYRPTFVCGPLSHDALFREVQAYLTGHDPDDDEPDAHTNGARA